MTLRPVLVANVVSAAISGGVCAVWSGEVSRFLGNDQPAIVMAVGIATLIYAAHVAWAAHRGNPGRLEVAYFAAGVTLWAVATAVLIASGTFITTPGGVFWAGALAAYVAVCAIFYWRAVSKTEV